jgi:N-acetylneuraminate lyase
MSDRIAGILPAIITPFTEDEQFSPGVMERLLGQLYIAGVDGVYVCGQTGEGLLQSVEMREHVAEVVVRNSPPEKLVVVHVSAARTADVLRLARHAARTGASAVSSLPPIGEYSFDEVRQHYERLASTCELPLLVYYYPDFCPSVKSVEQILELCAIPNVAGISFNDFDLFKLSRARLTCGTVLNGKDQILAAGLLMGADGGIGSFYNLVPELFVQLNGFASRNEWAEARRVQDRINELVAITTHFPLVPAIKKILSWTGIDAGPCLAPRRDLTSTEEIELRRLLQRAGFFAMTA